MLQKQVPNLVIFIFLIYKVTETLLQTSTRLQVYHLVCSHITRTDSSDLTSVCHRPDESNITDAELEVQIQKYAAPFMICYRSLLNLPAMFVCLVLGSWSDRNGRKCPMIIPMIGSCVSCCLFGISLIPGSSSIPFQIGWLLVGALFYGFCGKSSALGMGAHSYITDCSTERGRTTLIGRLMGSNFVGLCVGSLMVTLFYYFFSYGWVLLFVTAFNVALLLILVFLVKESVAVGPSQAATPDYGSTNGLDRLNRRNAGDEQKVQECEEEAGKNCGCYRSIKSSFKDSWDYIAKVRPDGRHIYLRILLGAVLFNQVTKAGEQDGLLLYVVRHGIGWSDGIYGAYLATYYASMAFNLIVLFPIVEYLFQPSDISLILFGLVMKSIRLLGTAFTNNTVLIFIFAVLGSSAGYIISALRSMITKLADSGEIGTSFALMSVLETFANLLGSILFTSVYTATVAVFPGIIFIIDACLHLGMLFLMAWLGWRLRRVSTPR